MLPGQKESAERLRIELRLGLCTLSDVVAWADGVVARDPGPDAELLELATCSRSSHDDVCILLESVQGESASTRAVRRVLGTLRNALACDPTSGERIARQIYEMAQWGFLPHEVFGWEPYSLEDHFYLAACGYCGDQASAARAVDEFLARYEERSIC